MSSSQKLNGSVAAMGSPWYSTTPSLGCSWDRQGRAAEEPREDRLGKPKPERSMRLHLAARRVQLRLGLSGGAWPLLQPRQLQEGAGLRGEDLYCKGSWGRTGIHLQLFVFIGFTPKTEFFYL